MYGALIFMFLNQRQVQLGRHALGLPNRERKTYRNHYVTGSGPDFDEWRAMVEIGAARHRTGNELSGGDDIFWLTADGAAAVLAPGERLSEDFHARGQ